MVAAMSTIRERPMTGGQRAELEQKMATLVDRLNKGDELIAQKRALGEDVSRLEDFWVDLLREYETTCAQLAELGWSPN